MQLMKLLAWGNHINILVRQLYSLKNCACHVLFIKIYYTTTVWDLSELSKYLEWRIIRDRHHVVIKYMHWQDLEFFLRGLLLLKLYFMHLLKQLIPSFCHLQVWFIVQFIFCSNSYYSIDFTTFPTQCLCMCMNDYCLIYVKPVSHTHTGLKQVYSFISRSPVKYL